MPRRMETRNAGPSNEGLRKLDVLSRLTELQELFLDGIGLTDLRPLGSLAHLRVVDIGRTLVTDLTPLAGLAELEDLKYLPEVAPLPESLAALGQLEVLTLGSETPMDLAALANLTNLRALRLIGEGVRDLGPIAGLSKLRELNCDATSVAQLAPLTTLNSLETLVIGNGQVADLKPLADLLALRELSIESSKLDDLAGVESLRSLRTIRVAGSQVRNLNPLAQLGGLEFLTITDGPVEEIGALVALRNLRYLCIAKTQVSDLRPLAGLNALETLDVCRTPVSDLSPLLPQIRSGLHVRWTEPKPGELGLFVKGCPLTNPPVEIAQQGNEAILNYFREREAGEVDQLLEAKLLILGEGGAGKTSLLRRLYEPGQPLPTPQETTRGISIFGHDFQLRSGRTFRLNVWDFGGQEIYHATHQFFLTRRSLYLLVDDTRKDNRAVSDEGFRYWLELIDLFGGHSPVLIFQNEKGGRSKAIDFAGIRGRYDNVKELYSGDLNQSNSVDALREAIEFQAAHLSHVGEQLPARWLKVRADLEDRAAEMPYIGQSEYFEIYKRHLELDRAKALHLSRYLHDLGVFLHFQDDPLLSRVVILRNSWATDAVFRILDDEPVKSRLGRFNLDDCARLWAEPHYADMHPELLALMQRFELCYPLADRRPLTWLAPQLLPPSEPVALAGWSHSDDLRLRYVYDFLPKGLVARLIVRMNRFVRDPTRAWVTGVLFAHDQSEVLVRVLEKGNEIELRAKGGEGKAMLSIIMADLEALNESFQGLRDKVDKRIPCSCKNCRASDTPHFFEYRAMLKRRQDQRMSIECPKSYESVDVLELLDGVRSIVLPEWAADVRSERTVRIFLASSSELRADRDDLVSYLRQCNDQLRREGLYLEIVRWEHFLDAMSDTRLQEEYNAAIRRCDVFVALFFTKAGKYTEEEFNVAYGHFKTTGRPYLYTFFKNAPIMIGDAHREDMNSLWSFKDRLRELGHYVTIYKTGEDLKLQFRTQLDLLKYKLEIPPGR